MDDGLAAPPPRAIDIIVPFYKRPDLVSPLFASIHRLGPELEKLGCAIIAVNDSPDDLGLKEELAREAQRLAGIRECTILENQANEGFVRSANRALRETIRRGHDAILLNSDTVLFPGAVSEMQRVAYLDPAIGFVSPRSNNATLCSLPHQREYSSLPPEEAFAIYSALAGCLPDYHYVPTGVGFCLYIKLPVLEQVGILDDIYSPGYNEENDLIMRALGRRRRVALANHAYVYHAGAASFSTGATPGADLEKRNLATLTKRYPHFIKRVDEYYRSAHLQAELLLTGLLADGAGRRDLLLDLSALPPRDDHVSRAVKEIVIRAVEQWRPWFHIFVAGYRESLEFHRLHELSGVSIASLETSRLFAVAVRFGLPCEYEQVVRLSGVAVCNVYAVLDPVIPGTPFFEARLLDDLWDFVFQHADGVIYESGLVRDLCRAQYKCHPAVRECVGAGDTAWESDTEVIGHFLKETVECASFETILKRRLRSIRLLKARMMSGEIDSARDRALGDLEKLKREHLEKIEVSRREREQALNSLECLRRELDQVRQRERATLDLEAENRRLLVEVREGQLEIAGLRQSRTWRWTAPLRRLGGAVLHRFGRSSR
jgi:GT2 family glycosyltransferase